MALHFITRWNIRVVLRKFHLGFEVAAIVE